MIDQEMISKASIGQKFAGTMLLISGSLIQVFVVIVYLIACIICVGCFSTTDSSSKYLLEGSVYLMGAMALQVSGQIMMKFSNYILGRTKYMSGHDWVKKCGYEIVRDVGMVVGSWMILTSVGAYFFYRVNSAIGMLAASVICFYLVGRVDRLCSVVVKRDL